jgi:isopropylmalate/homocitrate/citramalate synthase
LVGNRHGVVLGKKSGVHSIEWKLRQLGVEAAAGQVERMLTQVKRTSEEKKSGLTDDEFLSIVSKVLGRKVSVVANREGKR